MNTFPTLESAMFFLVKQGQDNSHISLSESLECYLVTTLTESVLYVDEDNVSNSPLPDIAQIDHTNSLVLKFIDCSYRGTYGSSRLYKQVGDNCLLLAGMFPKHIESRGLKKSLYESVAISSYTGAATLTSNDTWGGNVGRHCE